MLTSYFFIPGNRPRFFNKINQLKVDHFIIDLEDAISQSEVEQVYRNIPEIPDFETHYYRVRFDESLHDMMLHLLRLGIRNFVIPKVDSAKVLNEVLAPLITAYEVSLILLIESPKALISLNEILRFNQSSKIRGIALGSHDYAAAMHMEHNEQNLIYPRMTLLTYARAHDLQCIDIASMNFDDSTGFEQEVKNAFQMGFTGKFLIHPNQLKVLNAYEFYNPHEVQEAQMVLREVEKIGVENFSVLKFEGRLYERPHLERFRKIVKWYEAKRN